MKRYYFEPIFTKVQVEFLEEVLAGSAEDAVGGVVGGDSTDPSDDFEDWDDDGSGNDDGGFWW